MFNTSVAFRTLVVRYILMKVDNSYNILIGLGTLNKLKIVVSTPYMTMKFPSKDNKKKTW